MKNKPLLSFGNILSMSLGFMGIQMGFAIQNANASRILQTYGADVASTLASGPFKVTEWNKGQYVKFEKNENYWDAANVNLDELYIDNGELK